MPQPSPAFRPANQPSITLRLSRICSDLTFRDHPHLSPVFPGDQESASQFDNAMGSCSKVTFLECSQIILLLCKAQPGSHWNQSAVLLKGETKTKHQNQGSWFYYPSISIPLSTVRLPACLKPNLSWLVSNFKKPEILNSQGLQTLPHWVQSAAPRAKSLVGTLSPPTLRLFHGNWSTAIHQTQKLTAICSCSAGFFSHWWNHSAPWHTKSPACIPMPRHFFGQLLDRLPCQWIWLFFGPCWLMNFDRNNGITN